jgi:ribosomal protein S18 acetylase RimI-like enzyme
VWELHEEVMRDADALADPDSAITDALPDGEELDADLDAIEEEYLESGGEFLVGEVAGEVVAMGAFRPVDDETVEITRMRVAPDHQRRGYGRRMLDALEAEARERGYAAFELDTLARQAAARGLYEASGYRETERRTIGEYEVLFYRKSVE